MEQKLGLILGIFASLVGLVFMAGGYLLMDMHRKECKSCKLQGLDVNMCSRRNGWCKK